ncbi:tetratricopeptide repeat protein [Bradyrhizobium sp. Arg816]|uniref:tetratricopeptide repeat protein n=1 Tax=Bradyrhizobium sp. Arg816 TaxID=2998491 RepID=UPI00249F0CA9|nr:tetratricopeptide repeat protein [Bradyrhizobium sp. Arg816]MDI3561206.1 tetratricopeptide repeat protein [Bradyrhizobium sp. Arg816]
MVDKHLVHIAGLEKKFGAASEEVAVALDTLAGLICQYEESEDAVPYFERCLAIRETLRGPASILPWIDGWLGQRHPMSFKAREPFLLKRLDIMASTQGEFDRRISDQCDSLASIYLNLNRLADARRLLERSLAIKERLKGAHSADVVPTLGTLIDICLRERKREQADRYLEQHLDAMDAAFGETTKEAAAAMVPLAVTLISSSQFERPRYEPEGIRRARVLFEAALTIYEEQSGPDSVEVQRTLERISRACLESGQFHHAAPLLKRLLSICERIYGDDAAALLWILSELAHGYADAGSMEAEPLLERSHDVLRRFLDAGKPTVRQEIRDLAGDKQVLYRGRGNLVERLVRTSEMVRGITRKRWGA